MNMANLCDLDRRTFAAWELYVDVIKRLSMSKQGCVALLYREDFTCNQCRGTRDTVCPVCSDWRR
eukprot:SAG31_NODE_32135_length_359_cov_1.357692_1_plen_64_part_01